MSLACARARVTATVRPASGPDACQEICSASSLTGPTTVIAGGRTPACATAWASSPEGRPHGALAGQRAGLHDRGRLGGGAPGGDQRGGDLLDAGDPHVQHERPREGRQRLPVEVALGLGRVLVAGDERDRAGDAPLGDGDARVGGSRDPGGDARHHLERNRRRRAA